MKIKARVTLLCVLLFPAFIQLLPAVDIHQDIIAAARGYVGSGYCNGSAAPPCFDCSGFVYHLFSPHIDGLPRVSRQMARIGQPIQKAELRPGDLVFFATSPAAGVISHVALYIGQNSIIHAISDGPNRGVNITRLDARYWRTRYHSAARLLTDSISSERTAEAVEFANGTYTGELKSGEPHGQGQLALDNGDLYRGEFSRGEFHGKGTYIWKSGQRFEGRFREGVFHGEGVFVRADGTRVEGVWKDGELTEGAAASAHTSEESPASDALYTEKAVSPWDTWEGYVMGDYAAWKAREEQSFEEWKKQNNPFE